MESCFKQSKGNIWEAGDTYKGIKTGHGHQSGKRQVQRGRKWPDSVDLSENTIRDCLGMN